MSRLFRLSLIFVILLTVLPVFPATAQTPPPNCVEGTQKSGAVYRICMPPPPLTWNGDLVVYAHGYVPDLGQPVAIPEDQLYISGTYIPDLINSMGYASAVTSYSANGLAVTEGVADVRDLVRVFKRTVEPEEVNHVYLVGVSEGGLVTALAVEKFPDVFSGGLATCGPVGDLREQINYWGDFRVIFDYFFPGALPLWSPQNVMIPPEVMAGWGTVYAPDIALQLSLNPLATQQLLNVTQAPIDPGNLSSIPETVLGILWYNVFATNDGIAKLRGQPFDNNPRTYLGSGDDALLNSTVQRFDADRRALKRIGSRYQTSGALEVPLVTLHTTGDPIVPYWHELLYEAKVTASGSSLLYSNIPIARYGHCSFTLAEVLVAFQTLVLKVTGQGLADVSRALPDAEAQAEFLQLTRQYSALR
jgi:pimeloyl-ACP methyl ester carboxylesterase